MRSPAGSIGLVLGSVLSLAACTAHAPHRLNAKGEAVVARIHPGDLTTAAGRRRVDSSALEVHDDFELLFLEFDDQGSLFSRAPLDLLIETLRKDSERPDAPRITLVVFAPGWKNDARLCNRNACCFRSFLSRIASDLKMVQQKSRNMLGPSRTIGIFIGWRGLSATIPPFRDLSFYARKRAAQTIGQGELVEVLTYLDRFQKRLNERDPRRCRLVIMGHSFGGAMLYTAIANVLKSRIVDAQLRSQVSGKQEPLVGFGDLVVLANPAFEASLYQPFQELLDRFPAYPPDQQPVLAILSSETDRSTRIFFKLGRMISTLFQRTGPRSPRKSLVTTVGNYDPFVTHHAKSNEPARREQSHSMMSTFAGCECKLAMPDLSPESLDRLAELLRPASGAAPDALPPLSCPGVDRLDSVELSCVTAHPVPLWVVRASDDVISGHSGFFTRPVSDLVRGLVVRRVIQELRHPTKAEDRAPG